MLWCFCCCCVFSDLQLCKQLSQYCQDKFIFLALPLLKLDSWESASSDALSVSYSRDLLLVIYKSWEVTIQGYLILEPFFNLFSVDQFTVDQPTVANFFPLFILSVLVVIPFFTLFKRFSVPLCGIFSIIHLSSISNLISALCMEKSLMEKHL